MPVYQVMLTYLITVESKVEKERSYVIYNKYQSMMSVYYYGDEILEGTFIVLC